ncbi:MAG: LPS-assembly protein LptD [Bosea sp.]|uniref:LPS-assembly protein LptD n=1 Tax=Bosea sp. (in: a-proteobacteria) TaxID=1871050 RepID=UPI00238C8EF2|nr:LPS-assembly protein LptD [Bosea sp. (in: a-proteobacteria)]MCP4736683.1 LPS-assembly protein LptD [Bosea sp. (in: a-proteobacteria)]
MASGVRRIKRLAAATALVTTLAPVLGWTSLAYAQAPAGSKPGERMVVDARELVYDKDNNTVSAVGDVQILYQGRTIEADRVVYDRQSKRVVATGNARITESNGTVITGDRFNLTDDFRDGFIDSLRVVNTDKTRFSAPRAERTDGEVFVFDKGIYTACEPCVDQPERPPFWQVRAARIIHKKAEQMIYYEEARLEFAGVPIAYIPYMSGPDATVKRKTGFLAPKFLNTSALGYGFSLPYFINLAPNYDLTLTPTYLTRQGFLGQAEWRHRFVNGSYNIRAAGIFQQDQKAFLPSPLGAGDDKFRGSVETSGKVFLNPRWNFSWDIAAATDRYFFKNYRIRSESITASNYLQESTSTASLNGQSADAWFDMRGYYFQPLTYYDWQKQQPIVAPVVDYNKRVHKPSMIGGELSFTVNLTSLTREAASFKALTPADQRYLITNPGDAAAGLVGYSLFDGCAVYQKGKCLVTGLAGSISRATAEVDWRRNFIDPIGQVWTPYASVRADVFSISPNTTKYANANVATIADTSDEVFGRAMPAVGLMYRFPFVASTSWGTHIIEPVAQVVARPNETNSLRVANEDAQSLVFDDTNLFEWNKFSGYDRVEGGSRANIGLRYSGTFGTESYANLLVGQSYHLGGRNSYTSGDLTNTGLNSGLDTRKSDYVAKAQFQPFKGLLLQAGGRFNETTFEAQRIDASAVFSYKFLSTSIGYSRYEPQPDLGITRRREGLSISQSVSFAQYWSVRGSVLFDLDKFKYDRERFRDALALYEAYPTVYANPAYPSTGPFQAASASLGLRYQDECTIFDVSYTQSYADRQAGATKDTRTVMFKLELRTLGEISYSQNLGATSTGDGVSSSSR